MLNGSAVVDLVNAIVPLYLCVILGYGTSKLRILPHEQTYTGIGGYAARFAIPLLIFRMVAANDPFNMNGKLILTDIIFKVAVLMVLSVNCFYRPTHQYLGWVSVLFNLLTMPNSVIIGTPLLTALYPGTAKDVTTLVFLQCVLWLSVCILLLEVHKAAYESSEDFNELGPLESESHGGKEIAAAEHNFGDGETFIDSQTKLPDSATPDPKAMSVREADPEAERQQSGVTVGTQIVIHMTQDEGSNAAKGDVMKVKLAKRPLWRKIALTVLYKFFWAPAVWGSILGFIYSIFNVKFNHGRALPVILKSFVDLIANSTLGICMFMLGMNMAMAPKLFACGIPQTLLGAALRFIVAPASLAVISFAVGLRGTMFRFAVMQSMVPQALLSFVWASQYNVHVDIFSTAVWFQTATFFPFAIVLDLLLGIGS